jgi:hypothetical protein
LAKFVLRLIDEDDWPEQCAVVGQDVTFNQMLEWVEHATGRKFHVEYDSLEKLEAGDVTVLNESMTSSEFLIAASRLFGVMTVKGFILIPEEKGFRLNERFPDIDVLTVERMVRDSWAKELGSL